MTLRLQQQALHSTSVPAAEESSETDSVHTEASSEQTAEEIWHNREKQFIFWMIIVGILVVLLLSLGLAWRTHSTTCTHALLDQEESIPRDLHNNHEPLVIELQHPMSSSSRSSSSSGSSSTPPSATRTVETKLFPKEHKHRSLGWFCRGNDSIVVAQEPTYLSRGTNNEIIWVDTKSDQNLLAFEMKWGSRHRLRIQHIASGKWYGLSDSRQPQWQDTIYYWSWNRHQKNPLVSKGIKS